VTEGVEAFGAEEHEREGRCERDDSGEQSATDAVGRVADHGHRLSHWPRSDLTERYRVEELRVRHPVVGVDGVGLHERDDHEAAAVRERAHLERDPDQRQHTAGSGGGRGRDRPRLHAGAVTTGLELPRDLDRAAAE
jgi:hypothetical protein